MSDSLQLSFMSIIQAKVPYNIARLTNNRSRHEFGNESIWAAIFYGICSSSMTFLNKAVISSYNFNFPIFIMACQMTFSITFLEIMLYLGKIHIPTFTFKAARGFLLLSLTYGLHSVLSLMALRGMNIPIYTAVKRCTPLVNLIFAWVILRKPFPSFALILSTHIVTVGCIIAVYGDLKFDPFTYSVGALCVIAQGLHLTLVQKASENHFSIFEILHINSYITFVPLIILSFLVGELEQLVKHPYVTDPSFLLVFWILLLGGSLLHYSLFLCTSLNSALTTSLVGVGKSSLQTFVGFFVFGGIKYDSWTLTGLFLNFVGGIIYFYVKYKEKSDKPPITVNSQSTEKYDLKEILTGGRS